MITVKAGIVCYIGDIECLEMQDFDGHVWQVHPFKQFTKEFPEIAEQVRAAKGKSVEIEVSMKIAECTR